MREQLKARVQSFQLRIVSSNDYEGGISSAGSTSSVSSGSVGNVSKVAQQNISYSHSLSGIVKVGNNTAELLETVAILRSLGAIHIDITPLNYRFEKESMSVRSLHERLKRLR